MKLASLRVAAAGLAVICSAADIDGEPQNRRGTHQRAPAISASLTPMTSLEIGKMLIERRQASRPPQLLPLQAQKLRDQKAALEIVGELYKKKLISKLEMENYESAAVSSGTESERSRESVTQDRRTRPTVKISSGTKASRSAPAAPKRSLAIKGLLRHGGTANWTPDDLDKIDVFFRQRFGRPLPVSARGQSLTHDRLGLDHSEAVDVAVRPGSAEGRALMAYLRAAEIPFTAFRGRVSRMSTGPHIHIGPPSPRLILVERDATDAEKSEERAEQS